MGISNEVKGVTACDLRAALENEEVLKAIEAKAYSKEEIDVCDYIFQKTSTPDQSSTYKVQGPCIFYKFSKSKDSHLTDIKLVNGKVTLKRWKKEVVKKNDDPHHIKISPWNTREDYVEGKARFFKEDIGASFWNTPEEYVESIDHFNKGDISFLDFIHINPENGQVYGFQAGTWNGAAYYMQYYDRDRKEFEGTTVSNEDMVKSIRSSLGLETKDISTFCDD